MAGRTRLQAAINHQVVALQTLRFLQQQRSRRDGPLGPGPVSGAPGPAGRPEDRERAGGPSEGPSEERPAEARDGGGGSAEARPGGERGAAARDPGEGPPCKLARVVVRTVLNRVVESTSQLIRVEQTILKPLHQLENFPVYLKDSVEFRNICSHMALQLEGQLFDRDLNEAYQCLKNIIKKLLRSVMSIPADTSAMSCIALRQVLHNLLDL
ncbi:leukemia-associated protein 7 [Macrotis lagotis]|uniref:leukemia-associated protein 7 n=1 Tax=Macrotis lagotis TaxID=92651 RepID=UPI003D695FCC